MTTWEERFGPTASTGRHWNWLGFQFSWGWVSDTRHHPWHRAYGVSRYTRLGPYYFSFNFSLYTRAGFPLRRCTWVRVGRRVPKT